MGREGGWGRWGSRANPSTERGVFDFGWKFLALSPSETAAATSRTKRGTTGSGHPNGERQQLRRVVRRAAGGAVTPRADGRRASGVTGQRWQLQQRGANHTTRELAQEEAQWRLHLVAAGTLGFRARTFLGERAHVVTPLVVAVEQHVGVGPVHEVHGGFLAHVAAEVPPRGRRPLWPPSLPLSCCKASSLACPSTSASWCCEGYIG